MKEVSQKNLGPLIAYVVPGLVVLWGISPFSKTVDTWLTTANGSMPTVAGFLYVTLGSLAAGLTLNGIRSVTVDVIHHRTGVKSAEFDFSEFQAKFWAFNQLFESHYRYYQFYSHMFLAVAFLIGTRLVTAPWQGPRWCGPAVAVLEIVLFFSGRKSLTKYYASASHLLGVVEKPRGKKKRREVIDEGRKPSPEREANGETAWHG